MIELFKSIVETALPQLAPEEQMQSMRDFAKEAEEYVKTLPDMDVNDEYY